MIQHVQEPLVVQCVIGVSCWLNHPTKSMHLMGQFIGDIFGTILEDDFGIKWGVGHKTMGFQGDFNGISIGYHVMNQWDLKDVFNRIWLEFNGLSSFADQLIMYGIPNAWDVRVGKVLINQGINRGILFLDKANCRTTVFWWLWRSLETTKMHSWRLAVGSVQ